VANVSEDRSRAQLLLVGALALAVVFLSLSLLLNSVIYTENLATRQTHADAEKATEFRLAAVDGLDGAIEHANRRNTTAFADRRDAYRDAVDSWVPILANYSATDGMATDVEPDELHEGTRIVGANNTTGLVRGDGAGDWTVATDSKVRRFRLHVDPSTVGTGDEVRITFDDGTTRTVVIENPGSGPRVRIERPGPDPTCSLSDGRIDIGTGRVDGEYCPGLADARPTGNGAVSIANGDQVTATYSLVVDRHQDGFRTDVDTENYPTQCTPPSTPTYGTSSADDPYTTPAIYAATAEIGASTRDLDYRRTIRAAPDEAGDPASEPTFTQFLVTQSGNDFTVDWNTDDPNGDIDHVDVRVYYRTNDTLYASETSALESGTETFANVPAEAYYVNGTVTDAASSRRVSEIHDAGGCPP